MHQARQAISLIKGKSEVLNSKNVLMEHALKTISFIADISDILVIMTRRPSEDNPKKILCHIFQSEEASYISQNIGQAFQVAYLDFLKANGVDNPELIPDFAAENEDSFFASPSIYTKELPLFSNKDLQKEVIVPKAKGEILGVVLVESGWGSLIPTVVLAQLQPASPASRCGLLNIGDQIISVNGISCVGLSLSTTQTHIKNTHRHTAVKLSVVSCSPVVDVVIQRPSLKYQLGFSVQNGTICSLLRGGIAERGGIRVGHCIIEINGDSMVSVKHEKIVKILSQSIGEITMKTMPSSMFRMITGQESPSFI